jgi:hypothetical protein
VYDELFRPETMNLPNANLAIVDREKITEYLLNAAHPDNGGKAAFFADLGFTRPDWQTLANALRDLAAFSAVISSMESAHGMKYIVDGQIKTPRGKSPTVRTVWIIDLGSNVPRLITAYPRQEKQT